MNINIFLIIFFGAIVVILLLLIYYMYLCNKINYIVLRIDEANKRIDSNLKEKYELLNRSISLIKEKNKNEDILKEIVKLRSRKVSSFTLNEILDESYKEFKSLFDNNDTFKKSDELVKISKQLFIIENELEIVKNYYNENTIYYNKLLKKFPTNIVAKIKKISKKEFFTLVLEDN